MALNFLNNATFAGDITIDKGAGGNAILNFIENSGGTQNAKIEFDQSSQNQLYITTSYPSPSNTNRILLQPGGYSALIAYGGTSGVSSTKVEVTNDLEVDGDATVAGDVTIGSSGAPSDKTLNILTGGSKSAVKLMEAGTVYGFSTVYDGATNKFHINRHNNSAAGTPVLSLNRDDDNATFAGLVSGITPVAAANFVTKAYADGLTPGAGVFLPLVGGTMTGNIVMGDNDITGIDQLTFTSGTYLTDVSSNYIELRYASTGAGGIIVIDGDGTTQGYLYADGQATSSFGLLDGSGSWAVKCVEDAYVELRYDNAVKFQTTSTGASVTGQLITTGNVGIGTTSPQRLLQLRSTNQATGIFLERTSNYGFVQYNEVVGSVETYHLGFVNNNTFSSDILVANESGNVGIGTTSPDAKLEIIDTSNPGATSGSVIIEGRRDGSPNVLTLRAKDASAPASALPNGQGPVVRFQGFDGTDFENMGYIQVAADGQAVANGDAPSFMAFGTSADGSSSPTEKMRITSSGNVGIGTTSPGSKLQVSGDAYVTGQFGQGVAIANKVAAYGGEFRTSGASAQIFFGRSGSNIGSGAIGADSTYVFRVWTIPGFGNPFVIKQDGNVGIGTTSPGTINGTAFSSVGLHVKFSTLGRTITEGTSWGEYIMNHSGASANQRAKFIQSKAGNFNLGSYDDNGTQRLHARLDNNGTFFLGNTSTAYQTVFFDSTPGTVYGNGTLQISPLTSPGSGIAQFTTNFADRVGGGTTKHNVRVGGTVTATDFIGGSGAYLPLAGGTMTGDLKLNDDVVAKFGTGDDLRIQHASGGGGSSFIQNYTGNLLIQQRAADKDLIFSADDGSGGVTTYLTLDGGTTHAYFSNPGNVGIGTTGPTSKLQVNYSAAPSFAGNGGANALTLIRDDSGGDLNEVGAGLVFAQRYINTATASIGVGGIYGVKTIASGSFGGGLAFYTQPFGSGSMDRRMIINHAGAIKFNNYDSTNQTGTPTYVLGTDASGNVVKVLGGDIPGGGTVTGSGTTNYIPMWTSSTALGNSVVFQTGTNRLDALVDTLELSNDWTIQSTDGNYWQRIRTVDGAPDTTNAFNFETRNGSGSFINHMTILNSGNVGIGTTSPQNLLHLGDNTNSKAGTIRIDSFVANQFWKLEPGTNTLNIKDYDGTSLVSFDGNSNFVLFNGGNVGIGTTSPQFKLQVSGSVALDVMPSNETEGTVRIGRYDANTSRYNDIKSYVSSTAASNYLKFAIHGGVENATVDVMTLKGNGNVGIGTTSPDNTLDVVASDVNITPNAESSAVFRRNGNNYLTILSNASNEGGILFGNAVDDNDGSVLYKHNTQSMQFATADAERMRITSSGNVGIGVTGPTEKLQVAGNAAFYGAIKGYTGSSSNQYLSIFQSGGQTFISTGTTGETLYFGIGPTVNVTNINVAGTATATNFILSSDKTLKDKIKDIKASHVDVKWKNFELISEPGVKRSGVIAQELEEKHPEFVRTDKDGLKSVAYIDLLITKIAELEARLEKAGL